MYINKDRALKLNFSRAAAAQFVMLLGSFFAARALVFDAASPFALAYISSFLFRGPKFYAAALFAALGLITSFRPDYSMKYLLAIVLLCLANLFLSIRPRMTAPIVQASAVAIAAVFSGLVLLFMRGQGVYFFVINLLEAALIFALAIVLAKGMACVGPRAKRRALNNEELVALVVLVGVLAVGASDIFIWQFSFRYFFAILIVLLSAQSGGASIGAACGMLLGFLLNISGFEYIFFAVLLSAAGFAAGAVRERGRLAPIFVFFGVAALCALYFDIALLSWGMLVSSTLAGAVFYFLPGNFLLNIHRVANPAFCEVDTYLGRAKTHVVARVLDFAAGYGRLATIFESHTLQPRTSTLRPAALAEAMKTQFCAKCHRHETCWGHKSADMAEYVKQLTAKSEKSGKIEIEDAPFGLSTTCIAPVDFIRSLWAQIGQQHMAKDLQQRLAEARGLVAQQFFGLSLVMYEFADELTAALNTQNALESKIAAELEKIGIGVENLIVIENKRGKCEVGLSVNARRKTARQAREIASVLSQAVGRRMELVEERFAGRMVRMEFFERHKFYVHSGIAKKSKSAATESGDSSSIIQLKDGRCVAALSDGMGSGSVARAESQATIELLEELMERGFEKEITLRLVNSALLMRSGGETFSTLDICVLDMNHGLAEFVKIGAAATYLLRGDQIATIGSWTLPVGILDSIDIDVQQRQLAHADIIVMMTDGVADSLNNADNSWIEELLSDIKMDNPQDIADHILDIASTNSGDILRDDMTVMVLRILER